MKQLESRLTRREVERAANSALAQLTRSGTALRAVHPAVIRHPVLDRSALYVSSGFTLRVEGMRHEEGQALLRDLFAAVEREDRIRTVPWQPGLLFLWDNRQLIHRANGQLHGQPSRSYRIGVYDGLPFYPGLPVTGEKQP